MATTEAAIVDRIRDVCAALGYTEAVSGDFSRQPTGAHDGVFTVAFVADPATGGMGFTEEARGTATVSLTRAVQDDFDAARRAAWAASRALMRAVVRDGAVTSGEYVVEDAGRGIEIDAPKGAAYLVCRVRIPINFEATL